MTKLHASPKTQAKTPATGNQRLSLGKGQDAESNAAIIPANDPGHFLVKGQLAERLQKTTRTVELWTKKGILPCLKIGRSVLYCWADVEAQLRERFTINRPASKKS
jgi:hypothetical protein